MVLRPSARTSLSSGLYSCFVLRMSQFKSRLSDPLFWLKEISCFPQSFQAKMRQYLDYAMTDSSHIRPNSSFTDHPIIRRYCNLRC
jgi:hypothetical protein